MKKILICAVLAALLAACTDYVQEISDHDGEWNRFVPSTMTDYRDGQTYKTVTIGNQTWMAENLNYVTAESYCYDEKTSNCTKYGHLYTLSAAMKACPEGWHLPDTTEWNTLFTAVGGFSTAGKMLTSTSGWNSSGNGTDAYSFSVLPASKWHGKEGDNAFFWSSTEDEYGFAYGMWLYCSLDYAYLGSAQKNNGFSVRCIKGEAVESSSNITPSSNSSAEPSSSSSVLEGYVDPSTVVKGTMTDSRDGQTYKTVSIGTQTWMAENLNYAYTGVPYSYRSNISDSTSWCYGKASANCTKYGRLYT